MALAETILDRAEEFVPQVWKTRLRRSIGAGEPATGILNTAKDLAADLIVVGTRGLGGLGRLMLGGVSRKVIRAASVPVLAVPKRPPAKESDGLRVLLACECLATGRQLVAALSRFTWPGGTHGEVLHAVPSIFVGEGIPDWMNSGLRAPDVEELVKSWVWDHTTRMKAAQVEMETLCGELPISLQPAVPVVVQGTPDLKILEVARRLGSELIVIGAKGSTLLERLMSGSTCESVLNDAPCSVLVIRHS
jgi:nucleotide-binding universal stress UspA family protein